MTMPQFIVRARGVPTQSLVIVMEEGPSIFEFDQPIVYWGAYEGAHGLYLVGLRMMI